VCLTKCGAPGHNRGTRELRGSRQVANNVSLRASVPPVGLEQSTLDFRHTSSDANGRDVGGRIRKSRRVVYEYCSNTKIPEEINMSLPVRDCIVTTQFVTMTKRSWRDPDLV
jgi:hypothetical protein